MPISTPTSTVPAQSLDGIHRSVVVIGAGQAGLSMSWWLTSRDIDHLVLERAQVAHEWRTRRWDSFCLVTPNWQCRLPGFPYRGADPDGFMVRDEIVAYLREFAESFPAPVFEGVAVTGLTSLTGGGFRVATSAGTLTAGQVVVATGPYQAPVTPRVAERLPEHVIQLHSGEYRNSDSLPAGAVLVVGSGQSGAQIAEDLHLARRSVHLAVGSAPRVARRNRGRDVVAWLDDMGFYRRGIDEFADAAAVRMRANHYVTGRDGGRDIDLRLFADQGMRLHGRLSGVSGGIATFDGTLRANLDNADAVSESIKDSIDAWITERDIDAPAEDRYRPVWQPPDDTPSTLDFITEGVTSVVWATGFGRDHRWIELPVFDGRGYPTHQRGVSTMPGLYFIGLPWQYTWGSGRFGGVSADAEYLTDRVTELMTAPDRYAEVHWIAGTPHSTYPRDDEWIAPRTA